MWVYINEKQEKVVYVVRLRKILYQCDTAYNIIHSMMVVCALFATGVFETPQRQQYVYMSASEYRVMNQIAYIILCLEEYLLLLLTTLLQLYIDHNNLLQHSVCMCRNSWKIWKDTCLGEHISVSKYCNCSVSIAT